MPLDNIKAISFDGDMTLWDFNKVMSYSLNMTLLEIKKRNSSTIAQALTLDSMIDIRNQVFEQQKIQFTSLEHSRYLAFKKTLASIDIEDDDFARELNLLYLKHRFESVELYSDVLTTLDKLKNKFSIGLLSNGNGYPEKSGLRGYFEYVIFSQDVKCEKPQKEIFLETCKRANCLPSELMHIGDSLKTDVAGANGVGAVSIWLNRESTSNSTGINPDFEINSLNEIMDILN